MLRTHELNDHIFDDIDSCSQILQDISQAIRNTYHTTTQASPGQLVFGSDILFNIPYTPDRDVIGESKETLINKNNQAENKSRVDHDYEVNGQVLIYRDRIYRKLEGPFLGPYNIVQTYTNGRVRIQLGTVTERINIRRLTPFSADK